jgi:hypothetical protein
MKMFKGIPGIEKLTQELTANLPKMSPGTEDGSTSVITQEEAKERLEKCQAFIQTVTTNLKENMSKLGADHLEAFQKNLEATMTQTKEEPK